jgi:hypothetical protein
MSPVYNVNYVRLAHEDLPTSSLLVFTLVAGSYIRITIDFFKLPSAKSGPLPKGEGEKKCSQFTAALQ